MKCPRCQNDMRREKKGVRSFTYVCPVCKLEISPKSRESDQYRQAYDIVTGKSEEQ